jgi:hypothetical protein
VRVQHLSTENRFLRERLAMVEASVPPVLAELSDKRELLHHAYVRCHRALCAAHDAAHEIAHERASGAHGKCQAAGTEAGSALSKEMAMLQAARVGVPPATAEVVNAWARGDRGGAKEDASSASRGGSARQVDDAMEAVLEDTLRLNRRLEGQLADEITRRKAAEDKLAAMSATAAVGDPPCAAPPAQPPQQPQPQPPLPQSQMANATGDDSGEKAAPPMAPQISDELSVTDGLAGKPEESAIEPTDSPKGAPVETAQRPPAVPVPVPPPMQLQASSAIDLQLYGGTQISGGRPVVEIVDARAPAHP